MCIYARVARGVGSPDFISFHEVSQMTDVLLSHLFCAFFAFIIEAMRVGISVHGSVTLWQPTERSLGPAMQHAQCRGLPLAPARTAGRGLGNTKRPKK